MPGIAINNLLVQAVYAAKGDVLGEIDLNWDAVEAADSYIIEYAEYRNNSKWILVDIVNESKYTVNGLKKNKTYLFRIAALNSDGQGPWSDSAAKKVY